MDYDLIILGAGPAGMTAGVYSARKMMKTLLLTGDVGGQMTWTKDVENYMGYRYITAQELLAKFNEQVEQFPNIEVSIGDVAKMIEKIEGGFKVVTANEIEYTSVVVIVATGKMPKRLNVPGEERLTGRGVAYCSTCDAPLYGGKKVAVVGGGNSAVEAVIDLMGVAQNVTAVNIAKEWQADQILLERVKKPNVQLLTQHEITEVIGGDSVEAIRVVPRNGGDPKTIPVQGVFVEIGLTPNGQIVGPLIKLNQLGEIPVDSSCKTTVPGLFAAGDVTDIPEKQIIVAAGEGAKAALSAYKYWARQEV